MSGLRQVLCEVIRGLALSGLAMNELLDETCSSIY